MADFTDGKSEEWSNGTLLQTASEPITSPGRARSLSFRFFSTSSKLATVSDLRHDLDALVFEPLNDPAHFAAGKLDPMMHTVVWPCGADFAPEFLRSRITAASA